MFRGFPLSRKLSTMEGLGRKWDQVNLQSNGLGVIPRGDIFNCIPKARKRWTVTLDGRGSTWCSGWLTLSTSTMEKEPLWQCGTGAIPNL